MTIHWFDDGLIETAKVGGKGSSLIEMRAAGWTVEPMPMPHGAHSVLAWREG